MPEGIRIYLCNGLCVELIEFYLFALKVEEKQEEEKYNDCAGEEVQSAETHSVPSLQQLIKT